MIQIQIDSLESEFDDSLTRFEGEKKRDPLEVVKEIRTMEALIAKVEAAQGYYNLHVEVEIGGDKMSLAEAIKAVGGVNRDRDRWKKLYKLEGGRYANRHRDMSRAADQTYAEWTINKAQVTSEAKNSTRLAGQFKAAIGVGNSTPVEISFLDAALIER